MAVFATGSNAQQQQAIKTVFGGLVAAGADIESFDVDAAVEQLAQQGIGEDLYHVRKTLNYLSTRIESG